ncbi:hypothetical protein NRS6185_00378 [Bacillus subtilis]|nr:hypothetical protein NRS6185_00378 [Bacillus subtilis]
MINTKIKTKSDVFLMNKLSNVQDKGLITQTGKDSMEKEEKR